MVRIGTMCIYYYIIAICMTAQSFRLSSDGFNSYIMRNSFKKRRMFRDVNRYEGTLVYSKVDDMEQISQLDRLNISDHLNNFNEIDRLEDVENIEGIGGVDIGVGIESLAVKVKDVEQAGVKLGVGLEKETEKLVELVEQQETETQEAKRTELINDMGENICAKNEKKILIDKSIIYTMPQDDYIVVGVVMSTYGLKGHVKVKSHTSQPEIRLCEPGYRYLKIPFNNEKVIPIKLERGRCSGNKDIYIVKFEGFDDVAQAQRLSRAQITIPLIESPPLEEDTYYSRDILGLNMYLYNDVSKTKLGTVVGFVHRSDLASRKKYEDICEDLIEVQIDMKVSLKTLIDVAKASKLKKESEDNDNDNNRYGVEKVGKVGKVEKNKGPTIVTERELDDADDLVDMYEEFEKPNFKSLLYLKCYECSICGKEFSNHTVALTHERMHEELGHGKKEFEGMFSKWEENDGNEGENEENKGNENRVDKPTVISIEDILNTETAKPIRRFYVPLVRNETIKYIDVQNKSIYVDPYTIFIGEDPKRT